MTTESLLAVIREYRAIKGMIEDLQDELEGHKQTMIRQLEARNVDTLRVDEYKISYTPYTTSRLDTTALKAELPNIAERFTKQVEAKRFAVA